MRMYSIKQFNEWGQCAVLNLLMSYEPETDQERFDILNILDDRLKSSSAAVVLVSCIPVWEAAI